MSKYHAKKITIDGITFDSKKEMARWCELKLLERAGEINFLERQVPFEIIPKQFNDQGKLVFRETKYIADFVYMEGNHLIVEDVKGMRTEVYKLKKKLMLLRHGILIKEV